MPRCDQDPQKVVWRSRQDSSTTTQDQTVSLNHRPSVAVTITKKTSCWWIAWRDAEVSEADASCSDKSHTPSARLATKYNQLSITKYIQMCLSCLLSAPPCWVVVFLRAFSILHWAAQYCLQKKKKKIWRPLWPIKTKTKSLFVAFSKASPL